MAGKYGIKEISELLGIPKSTIRYWDEQGLIHMERNTENDYREFTLQSLLEISDIAFYRKLNVPIKDMRNIMELSVEDVRTLLREEDTKAKESIEVLQNRRDIIAMRLEQLSEVRRCKWNKYKQSEPDFEEAVCLDKSSSAHWNHYLESPQDIILLANENDTFHIQEGLAYIEKNAKDQFLWKKPDQKTQYLECLAWVNANDPQDNNLDEHFSAIREMGYAPKRVIGRYLATAYYNRPLKHYRAWVEIG